MGLFGVDVRCTKNFLVLCTGCEQRGGCRDKFDDFHLGFIAVEERDSTLSWFCFDASGRAWEVSLSTKPHQNVLRVRSQQVWRGLTRRVRTEIVDIIEKCRSSKKSAAADIHKWFGDAT